MNATIESTNQPAIPLLGPAICSAASAETIAEKKAAANHKRSESLKRAWSNGEGKLAGKKRYPKLCQCGCGQMTSKYAAYVHGHSHRGKKQSAEWVSKKAAGMKRAWSDPEKMKTMRHQTPDMVERRTKHLRGKKHNADWVAKVKLGVKKAWEAGKFDGLKGADPKQMDKIRQLRDMPKLRRTLAAKASEQIKMWKETGQLDAIRRKGGLAKDMPDHIAAMQWTIRDPKGNVYEFSNLSSWARKHEHLFDDCAPSSKSPHWLRIAGGIADLLNAKGRSCSYRGWVAVSKTELEEGAADLLARNQQPNDEFRRTDPPLKP